MKNTPDNTENTAPSMGTLHILNKNPSKSTLYQQCLSTLQDADALLFIESAVYCSQDNQFTPAKEKVTYYLLKADLEARNINTIDTTVFNIIDDDEFVRLCCAYKKTISWF